jgi:hypothetical protein
MLLEIHRTFSLGSVIPFFFESRTIRSDRAGIQSDFAKKHKME